MNSDTIKILLKEKENLTLEFKEKYSSKMDEDIVAFSNTKGGIIILGIDDKGNMNGQELTNELKAKINTLARNCKPSIQANISQINEVIVIEVSEGEEKPHSCSSGYFRRLDGNSQKMNTNELRILFQKTDKVSFEEKYNEDMVFNDLSSQKINTFLKETGMRVKNSNPKNILSSINVAKGNKINNAGVMFFAKNPKKFISQCQMTLIAFKGNDKVHIYDRRDVQNDLLTQFNETIIFLEKHLNVRSEIKGVNRQDIYEIPFSALREGIINSIIHRDYSITGTSLMIEVYDNRIEITNPGGLANGLNKEDLGKISVRRNELIADYFSRMNKAERVGSGIKRMKEAMQKEKLPNPKIVINNSNSFFTIIFKRTIKAENAPVNAPVKISLVQQDILNQINADRNITYEKICEKIGKNRATVRRNIQKLKSTGLIKRVGSDKEGYWETIRNS